MELIPILSLIILVATISTFILAVGAYVLYKIRERKGQSAKAQEPASIPGELVAPAPLLAEQRMTQTGERRTFTEERFPTRGDSYVRETYVEKSAPTRERMTAGPDLRPTYISNPPERTNRTTSVDAQRITRVGGSKGNEVKPSKRKFMRYTNEGFTEPIKKEEKKNEGLKWR